MREEKYREPHRWDDPDPESHGLLLSDRIQFYVETIKLIVPFERSLLHAASYTLRAGDEYWLDDEPRKANERQQITVPKNGLIYLKIYEELNLPYYMIAMHDLKVKQVYRGFLAGRSTLIDPGYSGHIYYPLYNFTNEDKVIGVKDEIITMCFIKTTPFGASHFWKQGEERWSATMLKDRGSVPGFKNGYECLVNFPLPEREMHEYWIDQESHKSSVMEIRDDVAKVRHDLESAITKMEKTVNDETHDLRHQGLITAIVFVLTFFAMLLTTWGAIVYHFYWTRTEVTTLQSDIYQLSFSTNRMPKYEGDSASENKRPGAAYAPSRSEAPVDPNATGESNADRD